MDTDSTASSPQEGDKERAGIQSVEVGFALLDVLAQAPDPLMLRDLAAAAHMSAVWPARSCASTFAPFSKSSFTGMARPVRAASWGIGNSRFRAAENAAEPLIFGGRWYHAPLWRLPAHRGVGRVFRGNRARRRGRSCRRNRSATARRPRAGPVRSGIR